LVKLVGNTDISWWSFKNSYFYKNQIL